MKWDGKASGALDDDVACLADRLPQNLRVCRARALSYSCGDLPGSSSFVVVSSAWALYNLTIPPSAALSRRRRACGKAATLPPAHRLQTFGRTGGRDIRRRECGVRGYYLL